MVESHHPSIIKETATVRAVDVDYAWVESTAQSGCHSCDVNHSCGTGLISRMFGRKVFLHKIKNTLGANVGDEVIIAVPQRGVLLASMMLYCIPLITLFIGAVVAQTVFLSDFIAVVGGVIGLVLGLLFNRVSAHHLESARATQITMLGKVDTNMVLQIE